MVAGKRSVDGVGVDATMQSISEAPHWQGDGETVDVVDDTPVGEQTTEGVPVPEVERPDADGQTTLDDWGWSA